MSLPESNSVPTAHGTLAWREAGAGPALVLLHGLGGSSASWRAQYEGLSDEFRVIGWDCPGYGGSDDPPLKGLSVDTYVDALTILADHLELERFAVLGHSMGGLPAVRIASVAGERVDRLILSSTSSSFQSKREGFGARLGERRTLDNQAFGRARARGMLAPGVNRALFDEIAAIAGATRPTGYASAVHVLTTTDNRPALLHVTMPTLVLAGAGDQVVTRDETDALAQSIPNARMAVIDGAAHAAYAEQPASYNELLRAFLREGDDA